MNLLFVCFVKQKTAYDMRISDWSSDVCSSDLSLGREPAPRRHHQRRQARRAFHLGGLHALLRRTLHGGLSGGLLLPDQRRCGAAFQGSLHRSEEHTSDLQSLMRISYAVFCLKKKTHNITIQTTTHPQTD